MYGYRYSATSPVFPMPRHDKTAAAEEVRRRRAVQTGRGNQPTVELMEETEPGEWRPVDLEKVPATQPTGPRDPFAGIPIHRGRRRRK